MGFRIGSFFIYVTVLMLIPRLAMALQCVPEPTCSTQPAQCNGKKLFNLCFISLNNEKEFITTKKFADKLNKSGQSHHKINVIEYQEEGANPEEAVMKMISSGTVCHGLVISGHHTGSFGGKRSSGSLSLVFLEKLSCDPKYAPWFNRINALWLQGCRTLGENVTSGQGQDTINRADFHTLRVGAVRRVDHIEDQTRLDMQETYTALLDTDNPFSSRYLRAFPRAKVFGWTATSPGVKAGSENSIPYHVANVARLANLSHQRDDNKCIFDDPTLNNIGSLSTISYFNAFSRIFSGNCRECSKEALVGWEDHGKKGIKNEVKYGFMNPDLLGHEPLVSSSNENLLRAKELDCVLKNNSDKPKVMFKAIKEVLGDQKMIALTFSTIWSLLKELRYKNPEAYEKLKKVLASSKYVRGYLIRKLTSNRVGLVRKITYYSFLKEVIGEKNPEIEDKIIGASTKIFSKPFTTGDYDERDFRQSLFGSLSQHGYLDQRFLKSILEKIDSPETLFAFMSTVQNASGSLSKEEKRLLIDQVFVSPHFGEKIARSLNTLMKPLSMYINGRKTMSYSESNRETFNKLLAKFGKKWLSKKYLRENSDFASDLALNMIFYGEKKEEVDQFVSSTISSWSKGISWGEVDIVIGALERMSLGSKSHKAIQSKLPLIDLNNSPTLAFTLAEYDRKYWKSQNKKVIAEKINKQIQKCLAQGSKNHYSCPIVEEIDFNRVSSETLKEYPQLWDAVEKVSWVITNKNSITNEENSFMNRSLIELAVGLYKKGLGNGETLTKKLREEVIVALRSSSPEGVTEIDLTDVLDTVVEAVGVKKVIPSLVEGLVKEEGLNQALPIIEKLATLIIHDKVNLTEETIESIRQHPESAKYVTALYPYFKEKAPEVLQEARTSIEGGKDEGLARKLKIYDILLGEGSSEEKKEQFESLYGGGVKVEEIPSVLSALFVSSNPPDIVDAMVNQHVPLEFRQIGRAMLYSKMAREGNQFGDKYIEEMERGSLYGVSFQSFAFVLLDMKNKDLAERGITQFVAREDFTEEHFNYMESFFLDTHKVLKNKFIEEGKKRGFELKPGYYDYNQIIEGTQSW